MRVVAIGKDGLEIIQEENVTFLAAAVAFYAFLSIIPLLVLTLAVGSVLGADALANQILSLVGEQLSGEGESVVQAALTDPAGRGGASLVSIVALTWSALKVFRGLSLAFEQIYHAESGDSLIGQVIDSLTALVTIGLAAVVMIGLGTLLGRPELAAIPFLERTGWVLLVLGLAVVFLPLYYVMPPVDVTVRQALPGTVFASLGWFVLQAGFQLYAANAGQYQAYGFLGAILLFVLWLYFASVLVLLGAVFNSVLQKTG